jgi:PAS domain S-box-containing protein
MRPTHGLHGSRNFFVAASGGLSAAIGVAVLIGWYTRTLPLVQVHPAFPPMPFNSAVGFALAGAALLATAFGKWRLAAAAGGLVLVLGLLTLFEYLSGVGIGIDQLPMRYYLTFPALHPGRIPPNAALCFALVGSAVLLMSCPLRLRQRPLLLGLLGSVIISAGVMALFGLATGIATSGWNPLSRVAMHGSVEFMLLGCGVLGFAWRDGRGVETGPPHWLFASVTVAVLALTLWLWQALAASERGHIERSIQANADLIKAELAAAMSSRISALTRCARRWEQSEAPDRRNWEHDARVVLEYFPSIRAIAWVRPSFQLRWVVPPEGSADLENLDPGSDPRLRQVMETARDQRRPAMTGAAALPIGNRRLYIFVPLWKPTGFNGFVVGVLRPQDFLSHVLTPSVAPGYLIAVVDGEEEIYRRLGAGNGRQSEWAREATLEWEGVTWRLRLWPAPNVLAQLNSALPETVLVVGSLLACLLGSAVFLAQTAESARKEREKEADQRRRAEQDLEQFFTPLSLDMLCIAGPDGYFKRVNAAFESTLGWASQELLAEPFVNFVHPEDREATLQETQKLASGQITLHFENRYRCRDGAYRWLMWNAAPVPGRQLISAVARDVTEQKQAAEALRRAHQELEQRVRERTEELAKTNRGLQAEISARRRVQEERDRFFTLSRDLLCVTGFDGYIKSLSPAWERTLGFRTDELMARPILEAVLPEDRQATAADFQRLLANFETISFENRYRCKDGSYRWLLWNAVPLPEDRVIYAAARDITDLKQAEAALREREERFRKLFEEAPIGIALAGLDHRFIRVNRAFCEMLGYTEEELSQLTFDDITCPEDRAEDARLTEQTFEGESPGLKLEERYVSKNGETLWVDLTRTVIRKEDGTPLYALGMIENISERKIRDEQIRKLNQELAQRISELTAVNRELETFTYSVSHDLRAPLRQVDGFSKILLEEAGSGLDPQAQKWLQRIRDGSQRMGLMVDGLLNLARMVRPEPNLRLTALRSLVEEVLADLAPEMEGREIEIQVGELASVYCDPALMKQVFANLLSNAVKFTRPRKPALIQIGQLRQDRETVFFVRDNGVGLDMKYADKLFGVFQRLHRREDFEGTGIGLATVQRIIHKHAGRLWVEAQPEKGATFHFTLHTQQGWEAKAQVPAMLGG